MLPDLVLIDGGRGQLNVGLGVLQELGLDWHPGRSRSPSSRKRSTSARAPQPLALDPTSPALHTLQRIRDEAHRFAITYHKKLRGSPHDPVGARRASPASGPTIRTSLLKTLGSARRVREASVAELAAVPKVTPKLAQRIHDHFHATGSPAADTVARPRPGPSPAGTRAAGSGLVRRAPTQRRTTRTKEVTTMKKAIVADGGGADRWRSPVVWRWPAPARRSSRRAGTRPPR